MARWAGVLLVVTLAACTGGGGDDEPAARSEPAARPEPAVEAWSLDLDLVGPPVVVGDGVAVVLAAPAEHELLLVGVDVATGERLWETPTSPPAVPWSHAATPLVVEDADGEDAIIVSRWQERDPSPDDRNDLEHVIVRIDPRTGEDVWATVAVPLVAGPEPCPDQGVGGVCATVENPDGGVSIRRRIDLADGRIDPVAPPDGYVFRRSFGGGLVDLRVGQDHHVGLVRDGELVWVTPVDEAFGPRRSPDFGWVWVHDAEAGVFVGSVGRSSLGDRPVDLADNRIVALDETTGEILWTDESASIRCIERLALPGPWPPARGDEVTPPAVRCRAEGELPPAQELEEDDPLPDVPVTVEGYDPATGETTWSIAIGDAPEVALTSRDAERGRVGATGAAGTIVLPVDGTPAVVDLADGTTSEVGSGSVLACSGPTVVFTDPAPYVDPTGLGLSSTARGDDERLGGELVVPCGPDLEPVDAGLPPEAVAAVGVDAGATTLVALDGRLVGYDAP